MVIHGNSTDPSPSPPSPPAPIFVGDPHRRINRPRSRGWNDVCPFTAKITVSPPLSPLLPGELHLRPASPNQFPLLVSVTLYDGEQLNLTRITRSEMGAYLCIATNGVPPTVSKRITVDVECELVGMLRIIITPFARRALQI